MGKIYLYVGLTVVVLAGILWYARPNPEAQSTNDSPTVSTVVNNVLKADKGFYDFGTISMKGGNVSTTFVIENSKSQPLSITKLYTSCMCTTAILDIDGVMEGPFGMLGHGLNPKPFNQTLAAGQTAKVVVEFDPNAHGPSGIGLIERQIVIENARGRLITLDFKANVTP